MNLWNNIKCCLFIFAPFSSSNQTKIPYPPLAKRSSESQSNHVGNFGRNKRNADEHANASPLLCCRDNTDTDNKLTRDPMRESHEFGDLFGMFNMEQESIIPEKKMIIYKCPQQ